MTAWDVHYLSVRIIHMMTGAQIRAARGFLNWSVRDLGKKAKVHFNTVHAIERGKSIGKPETLAAIRTAKGRGAIHQREAAWSEAEGVKGDNGSVIPRPRASQPRQAHAARRIEPHLIAVLLFGRLQPVRQRQPYGSRC
jgi:transcriptional regulator with XRE-family HTH domain